MRPSGYWVRLIVVGLSSVAGLGLAGCSREPQPDTPPSVPSSRPSQAVDELGEAPPQLPPADSGLAIKRGVMTVEKDRATFSPCHESGALWVLDQTDALLTRTFDPELEAGSLDLYVEAYGERVPVSDDIAAARDYPGMFVLEEVLYASRNKVARGCDEPAPEYIVAARGNEPFWSVEVGESHMVWRSPAEPAEITLDAAPAQDAEGAVRYQAGGGGHELELLLDAQPCRDSMSGDFFAYAARAVLDGEEFRGCARVGK